MAAKKLDPKSKYAALDTDGDGVVSDGEMAMGDAEFKMKERSVRLENEDKQADTQRMMALVSVVVSIVGVTFLLLPIIPLDRMEAISSVLSTFLIANTGIVAAYITGSALSKTKLK